MVQRRAKSRSRSGWVSTRLAGLVFVGGLCGSVVVEAAAQQAVRIPAEPYGRGTPADPCVVCHSVERGGAFRVAPNLWGIVGAEKARDREWFGYTPALRNLDGVWTEEDLDAYLEDASKFAPGSSKSIRLRDPEQRRAVIDYLKTLQ